ncbi:hypothetical protein [Nocardia wallacei]|uniref:hypothetical protein n=1 Tax=Nocardia wallacei TaxID=480035 RepID=UPI0024548087|nr:hypothetical protein [Nocardia wallacei]
MTLLVGSGVVSTVIGTIGAIVGAVLGRRGKRLESADYAEIAARVSTSGATMSQAIADDLREDNQQLNEKVDRLQSSVEGLRERIAELTDAIWKAVHRIESHGHDATDLRAVITGRVNGTPPPS